MKILFYDNPDCDDFVDKNLRKFLLVLNELTEGLNTVDSLHTFIDFYLNNYKHLFHGRTIVSIDGNIGIGKSYSLKKLMLENQALNLISEPVEYWSKIKCTQTYKNCLELYYESLDSNDSFFLFKFQLIVAVSKLINIINQFSKSSSTIFISERCFLTDKLVFIKIAKSMYRDVDLVEFEKVHLKIVNELYTESNLFMVYLNGGNEEQEIKLCAFRIKQRNRDGEDKISEEYLCKIQKAYLDLMSISKCMPYIKKCVTIGQDFCLKPNIWGRLIEKLYD